MKNQKVKNDLIQVYNAENRRILNLEAREQLEIKRKKAELKRRLLAYDSEMIRGNFVSITEANYISIIEHDPDCLLLIHDLHCKIQFRMS